MIVFLSTNLLSESLFALLVTAALLMLLEERLLLAGAFAGLATLTETAGVPLIAACILTLVARRRFRSAAVFAAVAMLIAAPWFGWSLSHGLHGVVSNIIAGLPASDKLRVLGRNLVLLLASPFSLLTGFENLFAVVGTVLILIWSLYARRQLVPDLFIALYCLALLFRTCPPERALAPILPLILWIVWRVFRLIRIREAAAAAVFVAALLPLWADVRRVRAPEVPDNRDEMQKLFGFIRANTSRDSILLANMDPVFYLNTGRKAVRGFAPSGFTLFYAQRQSAVTPDQLSSAITRSRVNYVVLTPDRGLPESPSFHKSVQALERGGVLEPVGIPGLAADYRLLHVTGR